MRRKSSVELHVNHERWLVSYSDFVTLLFAFFVVMYSISQVNEGKYRVLSNTLLEAFSVPQSAINPIQVGDPTLSVSPSIIEVDNPPNANAQPQGQTAQNQTEQLADLSELADDFSEQFADLIQDNLLRVNANEMWLEVELKDSILFPTASADPSLQAKAIFEEVAQMIAQFDNPVQVEGFTDNVPINNRRFTSNWELSAARSASVVKILANNGVSPQRLSAVGYGEFQPITDNSTAEGRAQNRRVVLMIARERSARPRLQDRAAIQDAIGTTPGSTLSEKENENEIKIEISTPAVTDSADNTLPNDDQAAAGGPLNNPQTTDPDATVEEEQTPLIEPIKLRDGGLLFTSDPDLSRSAEQQVDQQTDQETESN